MSTVSRRTDERGATASEYALLVGLIALVIVASVAALGTTAGNMWQDSCNQLGSAMSAGTC